MKLAFVELCGFRGYQRKIRLDFADGFTILDGRNGAGKSTVFDAIEFALTGTLTKYDSARADGESVADYLWWSGPGGPAPADRCVEVGFHDGDAEVRVRRTPFASPKPDQVEALVATLCDRALAPASPLPQLCATAIIRDEHITRLSLDLKESERYGLLRDALGAIDSDRWIARGSALAALAKRRLTAADADVQAAAAELDSASKRLDEARSALVTDSVVAEAVARLRALTSSALPPDQLAGPVRELIARWEKEIAAAESLRSRWPTAESARARIAFLSEVVQTTADERHAAAAALAALQSTEPRPSSSSLADEARNLIDLAALGRRLGLRDGQCPLCGQPQAHDDFQEGLQRAEAFARRLNDEAARAAEHALVQTAAESRLAEATRAADAAELARAEAVGVIADLEREAAALGLEPGATMDELSSRIATLSEQLAPAQSDLRILETLRLNVAVERALHAMSEAKARLARAQERAGRARRADTRAHALHDAARRAAGETLDRRLERVLPLMSELYRRLRPHPFWNDIDYAVRGDVRRFLKLRVGDDLNPQFLFSSGQRRATGLAFLLAVNLSLAWSRWRTILLDDPVQHVDDCRTVHLAELAAQLVSDGRQVVCAVEDAALADLFCRRLPVAQVGMARRITLGPGEDGALTKLADRLLPPLPAQVLTSKSARQAAGS